ncbi:MAG: calcium/sodium antiporter [Olsenella sp.]|nr:calcium/sodium antiporter [Olsenella sp.]
MGMLFSVFILTIGFVLLVKGADVLVKGASGLATRFGISSMVVGLTVVALGTSLPEAAISIVSSANTVDELAIANVFGSNIMNTLVVLGLAAIMSQPAVPRSAVKMGIPLVLATTMLLLGLCTIDGMLGRFEAALLLVCLVVYLVTVVKMGIRSDGDGATEGAASAGSAGAEESSTAIVVSPKRERGIAYQLLLIVLGAVALAFGSDFVVDGASELARFAGLSERMIGLTVVALGTSLPELVTAITASSKGESDIAIGGIVGSNILNVLFVLGIAGVVSPIPFSPELMVDGIVSLAAAVLLWVACARAETLRRRWGVVMLGSYATYLAFLVVA